MTRRQAMRITRKQVRRYGDGENAGTEKQIANQRGGPCEVTRGRKKPDRKLDRSEGRSRAPARCPSTDMRLFADINTRRGTQETFCLT